MSERAAAVLWCLMIVNIGVLIGGFVVVGIELRNRAELVPTLESLRLLAVEIEDLKNAKGNGNKDAP